MANILTLTMRLHDPDEKKDATKSAAWVTELVPRIDLDLPVDEFVKKYITPNWPKFEVLKRAGK